MDKWLFCPVAEPGETNQSAFKAFPKTPRTAFNFTFGEGSARAGTSERLAPHGDLLEHGAIGLADDDALISPQLLEQGLVLGEMGSCPVLVAPRDPGLQGSGMVREGVETLRAGWPPDPMSSEILPISQLLALHQRHPDRQLRLMNLSTAAAVEQLVAFGDHPPLSSVNWWHLLADRNGLAADDPGWRVRPSLGGGARPRTAH
jgi:dihydroorotase